MLLLYKGSLQLLSDYSDKPPSNRTNTSRRIRLYGRPQYGWLDRALSLAGEARFTGCGQLLRQRQLRPSRSYEYAPFHGTRVRRKVDSRSPTSDAGPLIYCYSKRPNWSLAAVAEANS